MQTPQRKTRHPYFQFSNIFTRRTLLFDVAATSYRRFTIYTIPVFALVNRNVDNLGIEIGLLGPEIASLSPKSGFLGVPGEPDSGLLSSRESGRRAAIPAAGVHRILPGAVLRKERGMTKLEVILATDGRG